MRPESASMERKSEKSKGDYDLEDRITTLPDDLLSLIVLRLPVKESATTAILSKRWNIWKSATNLDFSDARFVIVKGYYRVCFIMYPRFAGDVLNWIQFAMNKKVGILELEFYTDSGYTGRRVDVTGEVLEYFLSNCAALERLTVNAAHNFVDLRVVGLSISLTHLTLIDCIRLKRIEPTLLHLPHAATVQDEATHLPRKLRTKETSLTRLVASSGSTK
ncbi:hypothetical protein ACLB2K_074105 [Fragaria x ananassa]